MWSLSPHIHIRLRCALGGKVFFFSWRGDTLRCFDLKAGTWSSRTPPHTFRQHPAAVALGGKLFVFSASRSAYQSEQSGSRSFDSYDPETDSWAQVASLPIQLGWISSVAAAQGQIFITITRAGHIRMFSFDLQKRSWTELIARIPERLCDLLRRTHIDGIVDHIGKARVGRTAFGLVHYCNYEFCFDPHHHRWVEQAIPAPPRLHNEVFYRDRYEGPGRDRWNEGPDPPGRDILHTVEGKLYSLHLIPAPAPPGQAGVAWHVGRIASMHLNCFDPQIGHWQQGPSLESPQEPAQQPVGPNSHFRSSLLGLYPA